MNHTYLPNTSETQVGAGLRSCRYSLPGGGLRNRLGDLMIFVTEWEEYSKQSTSTPPSLPAVMPHFEARCKLVNNDRAAASQPT